MVVVGDRWWSLVVVEVVALVIVCVEVVALVIVRVVVVGRWLLVVGVVVLSLLCADACCCRGTDRLSTHVNADVTTLIAVQRQCITPMFFTSLTYDCPHAYAYAYAYAYA